MNDTKGRRSYHERVCLQSGQYDLPKNDLPLRLRSASAFVKLPSTIPKIKPKIIISLQLSAISYQTIFQSDD
ncbi:hypothetical protein A3B39_01735 [Candidatus Daviesbacteria bacterium RIFCSPLOWO2_01_FULL_37_10]|nr:MAG: hypothetical protein A3B39_01735 [Candidatus Daviesbacteria bacterium RIFCSPLOWO2_01_FULL_37_10]